MNNKLNFLAAIELIQSAEKILITTHIKPDGDAIGSALALYNFTVSMGKEVYVIICESGTPDHYKFLTNSKKIKVYNPDIHDKIIYSVDAIFILDLSELSRVKMMENPIRNSQARKVLIDHHLEPDKFADLIISDPNAAAAGELIYYLIKQAKGRITKEIAECIYTAIYTDTGGFRFSNTTAEIHKIIAEMIENGANPDYIYEKIYNNNSYPKIKLFGKVTADMKPYLNNKLAIIKVPETVFKETNTKDEDTEGLSQVPLSMDGALVGALLVESEEKREIRVSLRSKGDINVRNIAVKYGGGGHKNAAGCRLQETNLAEAEQIIIKEVEKILPLS